MLFSNPQEQCWIWNNEGQEYFYDKHEWVRIRIEQEEWHDQSPVAPAEREIAATLERKSPFSITVSLLKAQEFNPLIRLGIDAAVSLGPYSMVVACR